MAILIRAAESLTFDDVLLEPQFSTLESRSQADTSTMIAGYKLAVPVISANMDTITDSKMAEAMHKAGGMGILHRYDSVENVLGDLKHLRNIGAPAIPSIGVHETDETLRKYLEYTDTICVDIAHGHSKKMVQTIKRLKEIGFKHVIAGNVATGHGAMTLVTAGADVIKVGIGPGSVCTTRQQTGHGVPQLSAILEVYRSVPRRVQIIADGGMNGYGDVVKALAAGANAVMTGKLFAGCPDTPLHSSGGIEIYRGMASEGAQLAHRKTIGNGLAEGVTVEVKPKPSARVIVGEIGAAIRSGMSYSGVGNLQELRENAVFRRVSPNTVRENGIRKE